MANLDNIYDTTVIDRGFVAHAVDAGIVTTIQSLISGQGVSIVTLLANLKDALISDNEALANSLSIDNLQLILDYMARIGVPPVVVPNDAPLLIDEDGPTGTWTSAGAGNTINITFQKPTAGQLVSPFSTYTAEVYANGVYQKSITGEASIGTQDTTVDVPGSVVHIRVCYVDDSDPAQMSRLGPTSTVNR